MSQSSDNFHRVNTTKVTNAMATVHTSTSARVARTYAAPAIAPVAAAETPSTNALTIGGV